MPSSESMISILKSNKNIMLDKSKRFKKTLGGYGLTDKTKFDFPDSSSELLDDIRNRLQKGKRILLLKRSFLFLMIIIVLLLIIIY